MKAIFVWSALAGVLLALGIRGDGATRQQQTGRPGVEGHALAAVLPALATAASCDVTTDYGDANGIALDTQGNVYTALGAASGAGGSAAGVDIQKWSPRVAPPRYLDNTGRAAWHEAPSGRHRRRYAWRHLCHRPERWADRQASAHGTIDGGVGCARSGGRPV